MNIYISQFTIALRVGLCEKSDLKMFKSESKFKTTDKNIQTKQMATVGGTSLKNKQIHTQNVKLIFQEPRRVIIGAR